MPEEDLRDFLESEKATGDTNAPAVPQLGTGPIPLFQTTSPGAILGPESARKALEAQRESQRQAYIQREQEPGVPLDITTGASPWERFWVGGMRDKEDALAYMQNKYGQSNVRLDKDGDFLFRVSDESGKAKDIKFRPDEMSVGDFLTLGNAVPEVLGSVFAIKAGRKLPTPTNLKTLYNLTRDVFLGAAGGEATGAARDIATHLAERGKLDLGKTLQERGVSAATDVALGYGTYGTGRFLKWLTGPFGGQRGPIQISGEEARKFLEQKFGRKIPITASELTGSPILGRGEVYTEIQPGGYGPLKKLKGEQEEALLDMQRMITGNAPANEQVAANVQRELDAILEPKDIAARTAEKELKQAGTQGIENIATAATAPQRELYRDVLGNDLRNKVIGLADAAKAKAETAYEDARKIHGVQDKIFDGRPLQDALRKILQNLPAAQVQRPTGIILPTGQPATAPVTEILEKWPPEKLLPRLREILSLPDPKFSYWDLKNMRRDVYDDLTKREAVPPLGAHYLVEIGGAITQEMDRIKNSLPMGGFRGAIDKADNIWKTEVMPFDRPGIKELFRREGETGFIPNDQVVSRIFTQARSPEIALHNWNLMRDTLGATSPDFTRLKRSLVDHMIESARVPGEQFIDPATLTRTLSDLRVKYPQIADEVFGSRMNELFRQAKFIDYAGNPKIANEDLADLLRDPSPTRLKLQALVDKQRDLDQLYRNDILKMVQENRLPKTSVDANEFVARFVDNPATTPQDISQVLTLMSGNPQLVADIQSKTVESLLANAGKRLGPQDVARAFAGQTTHVASGAGLVRQLEQPKQVEKLKLLLGPEKFEDLRQFANVIAATEYKYAASGAQMAGAFGSTHTYKALESAEFLKFAKPTVLNWFVAKMLTNPVFRAWSSRVPAEPGSISLFLTSPIFLQEVVRDMGGEKGRAFVANVKDSMDKWIRSEGRRQPTQVDRDYEMRAKAMQDFLEQQRQQK